MTLEELRRELDTLFSIHRWDGDPMMSRWVPRVYQAVGCDYSQVFEPDFCGRFNGLMLQSGDTVERVYCAAFPCPEVVEKLLEKGKVEGLLFLHHPIDLEVAGAGFFPIPPRALRQMKARGISVYSCHAPMDCHNEIGTTASIAQAFQVQVEQSFAQYGIGFAGRIGLIGPIDLEGLIAKGKEVFGVERVEVGGAEPESITRVAIVAGGGDDVAVMEEAEALGAQAYISGEWYTRTMPSGESDRRWAQGNRAACHAYAESSRMALLGFSHAASEFLVMKGPMADYFQRMGLEVECLTQSDWWR